MFSDEELLKVIASQREVQVDAARPRNVVAGEQADDSNIERNDTALRFLVAVPLVGYFIRIVASVYNLPKIVHNLSGHYASYRTEIRRLDVELTEVKSDLELAERRLSDALARLAVQERRALLDRDGGERT